MAPVRIALAGLVALAVAMGIGRFIYTPILPRMVEAGELTNARAGLLASANFAGYLVGALLAASPLVRGSRRRWLLAGLVASALTTGAMAFVGGDPAFAALRFGGGVASAFVLVFASALVLDRLAKAGRPGWSAVHFAGVGVGIAGSAVLTSLLVDAGTDWRGLWLAAGVASLAGAALAAALFARVNLAPAQAADGTLTVSRGRDLRPLVIGYGLFGFGYVITATFLVSIVRGSPEARPLESIVWLVVGLAAVPSVAVWAIVARRTSLAAAFALACLAEAVGVAATVLIPAGPGTLLGAVLLGATVMPITAFGFARVRAEAADPAHMLAVMTAAFGVGQIVGPSFGGVLFDASGSLLVPSLVAAAALALAAWLGLRDAPPEDGKRRPSLSPASVGDAVSAPAGSKPRRGVFSAPWGSSSTPGPAGPSPGRPSPRAR